jgi:hypothetical protein
MACMAGFVGNYGSYAHSDSEIRVTTQRRLNYAAGGQVKSYTQTLRIAGQLQANTPALVDTAMLALATAYAIQGQSFSLTMPAGGSSTAIILGSTTAIGGVRVVEGPNFEDDQKAEWSTYRNYNITLEAEYPATALLYLAWEESIDFEGGGPRDLFLQPLQGDPEKQRVAEKTTYRAVQRGSAVGFFAYPNYPPPLFPADEHQERRKRSKKPPKRAGPNGTPYYTEFGIEWQYEFEAVQPMNANPTLQPEN